MCKVSVIVPVYNTEKYLYRCIRSICDQSLDDIEVICVNDGSTDDSLVFLKKIADEDSRIKIIDKSHGGLVSTRKAGVSVAKGEYIGFVDSDDWIDTNLYSRLYSIAVKYGVDCVTSGFIQEGGYISTSFDSIEEGHYDNGNIVSLYEAMILDLKKKAKGISSSLCPKLFKTQLLKDVYKLIPNDITICEDKVTTVTFLLECKSVYVLHEAYYHYMINPGSMTNSGSSEYLNKICRVYEYLQTLYKHRNFNVKMRLQVEIYIIQQLTKGINSRLGFSIRNLFWIDPYWLEQIPAGSNIALYGAGELGQKYHQQMIAAAKHNFIGCYDLNYRSVKLDYPFDVKSPDLMISSGYDYVVITIKDAIKADEIKKYLLNLGIDGKKIMWFEQDEIFWKFAKADGLLDM